MAPLTLQSVLNPLSGRIALGQGKPSALQVEVEVDAFERRIEFDFFNAPGRLQAQRIGEQCLYLYAHLKAPGIRSSPTVPYYYGLSQSSSTRNDEGPKKSARLRWLAAGIDIGLRVHEILQDY